MTYKPANTISYSPATRERSSGDTATNLYRGPQVVLKDTPDSLVILQFGNNRINW